MTLQQEVQAAVDLVASTFELIQQRQALVDGSLAAHHHQLRRLDQRINDLEAGLKGATAAPTASEQPGPSMTSDPCPFIPDALVDAVAEDDVSMAGNDEPWPSDGDRALRAEELRLSKVYGMRAKRLARFRVTWRALRGSFVHSPDGELARGFYGRFETERRSRSTCQDLVRSWRALGMMMPPTTRNMHSRIVVAPAYRPCPRE